MNLFVINFRYTVVFRQKKICLSSPSFLMKTCVRPWIVINLNVVLNWDFIVIQSAVSIYLVLITSYELLFNNAEHHQCCRCRIKIIQNTVKLTVNWILKYIIRVAYSFEITMLSQVLMIFWSAKKTYFKWTSNIN